MIKEVILTSTIVLDDSFWGFNDLADGRPISKELIDEIKELIMEDSTELNEPKNWEVSIVTTRQKAVLKQYLKENK